MSREKRYLTGWLFIKVTASLPARQHSDYCGGTLTGAGIQENESATVRMFT